jgi:23S rRNA A2030 N6-methylase RlmJ
MPSVDASVGELLNAGIQSLLRIELDVGRPASDKADRLSATGLLIVNSPFGFAQTMTEVMPFLQRHLAQSSHSSGRVDILAES